MILYLFHHDNTQLGRSSRRCHSSTLLAAQATRLLIGRMHTHHLHSHYPSCGCHYSGARPPRRGHRGSSICESSCEMSTVSLRKPALLYSSFPLLLKSLTIERLLQRYSGRTWQHQISRKSTKPSSTMSQARSRPRLSSSIHQSQALVRS